MEALPPVPIEDLGRHLRERHEYMHAVVTNREMMISLWSAMIARYEGTATLVSVHELIHRPAGWGIGIRACTTHTHEEIS